jgi:hypothetical protein
VPIIFFLPCNLQKYKKNLYDNQDYVWDQPVDVQFPSADVGYVIINHPESPNLSQHHILRTTNKGVNWSGIY